MQMSMILRSKRSLQSQLGRRAHPHPVPLQLRLHLQDQASDLKTQEYESNRVTRKKTAKMIGSKEDGSCSAFLNEDLIR